MAVATPAAPAVRLLGSIEVVGPNGPALLVGARQRGLVALLALNAGTVMPQSRLVDALWGECPPRTAVRSLHSHVSRVRQALQSCGLGDVLLTREPGYLLALPRDEIDVHRFEDAVRGAHAAGGQGGLGDGGGRGGGDGRSGDGRDGDGRDGDGGDGYDGPRGLDGMIERLRAGLRLWRGDALADGEPAGWAAAEVERLHEVRLAAFEELWDAELRRGRHAAAVGELERELVGSPSRERLVGLLMLALYRCGRHAAALDRYQRLRARLADELGVDPGPRLQWLHTAILRRDQALDLPPVPAAAAAEATSGHPAPAAAGRQSGQAAVGQPGLAAAGQPELAAGGTLGLVAGGQPEASAVAVPRQLPPPVGHFAGRREELTALDRWQHDADADTRIVVVSGTAGVGKTAFAVQWAHQARARFPDGQLFLDLRGHDPDSALTPGEALTHALRALGVPADRIPADLGEQTGRYRSLTNGKRLLVVLDNGGTADHVLPLVPSTEAGLLLVTSRHQLAALAVHHGVRAVRLDVFSADEALALLDRVLGHDRVQREPQAVARLVELCGALPLALRIAAARLAARPMQDIGELTAELTDDRLDALAVEGDLRSVRNVFASAYGALSEPAARLFRLLGLHPGVSFTTYLASVLTGLSHGRARRSVDELAAAHLIAETASGRYRFHDLVRLYARECAEGEESGAQRQEAAERIAEWYLSIADAANRNLDPARDRVKPILRHDVGEPPFEAKPNSTLAFLDGERDNLASIVEFAADTGNDESAWQLAYLLAGYFESRGHWADRLAIGRCGLSAARRLGDAVVEGLMLSGLGVSCLAARRFEEALQHLSQALAVMRTIGDKRGEGHALNNLAATYAELHRFDDAVDSFEAALDVHTANGHRHGMTLTLNNLGHLYAQLGELDTSLRHLARGLALAREDGDTRLEAAVLHSIGQTHRRGGRYDDALQHFGRALALRRQIGDRRYEARTLNETGATHLLRGDRAAALADFGLALELCREIGDQHGAATALANLDMDRDSELAAPTPG